MCVVIGLQSTGEQRTSEEVDRIRAEEQELTEMVSSCKGVFRRLLEHHFPVSDRSKLESLGILHSFYHKGVVYDWLTLLKTVYSQIHWTESTVQLYRII